MNRFSTFFSPLSLLRVPQLLPFLFIVLSIFISSELLAQSTAKAKWYRYYDKNGVANISSTVSPEHLRHGYEALDRNMQVIRKNKPYDAKYEIRNAAEIQRKARQQSEDLKLKRAYGTSQVAVNKRNDMLKKITKQIAMTQQELKTVENDYLILKQDENKYIKKKKPVPSDLKNRIHYNIQNTQNIKTRIESLQTEYRNTQAEYDIIIKRLKNLE
ncbi:hypothetical protein [Acinetobacter shaoyimingii]|uniref:hypothetical protein n=1 Tax=Acinetobacter shaoyimingii TaxID=2715164 RepID=UPI001D0DD37A|nr:hypothetical protein [Acinetobacter shaoyimingii]